MSKIFCCTFESISCYKTFEDSWSFDGDEDSPRASRRILCSAANVGLKSSLFWDSLLMFDLTSDCFFESYFDNSDLIIETFYVLTARIEWGASLRLLPDAIDVFICLSNLLWGPGEINRELGTIYLICWHGFIPVSKVVTIWPLVLLNGLFCVRSIS